jgi:hypothetical protein
MTNLLPQVKQSALKSARTRIRSSTPAAAIFVFSFRLRRCEQPSVRENVKDGIDSTAEINSDFLRRIVGLIGAR